LHNSLSNDRSLRRLFHPKKQLFEAFDYEIVRAESKTFTHRRTALKACKNCGFNKVCSDLPGICILMQMAAVVVLVGTLSYLFVTQELLT
jgi:hypothetical protein